MKRALTFIAAAATAATLLASTPELVGHRGSGYGVENTADSFRKGIELGYRYLETDIKFTKDTILVCSHDDTTERLGGKLALADATLEQLQAEELRQNRNGIDYTGRICTFDEYLDICRDGGAIPVIELKYTAGINRNDTSNIPRLIAILDSKGMRDKCVILTSQKNCLEYIRSNYPGMTLQFLTGKYWANHFDWCVENRLDVDIQKGHFDKETVDKFHNAGLKVNVWTVNDPEEVKAFTEMGCDFITTDRYTEKTANN